MAQRTIAELAINLKANTAAFVKELDKSRTLSTAFGVTVGAVMANVAQSVARMGVNVATSLPRAFLAASEAADQLGKSSQKIGISVEALSGLKHAADLSGVSSTVFRPALKTPSCRGKGSGESWPASWMTSRGSPCARPSPVLKECSDNCSAASPESLVAGGSTGDPFRPIPPT